MTEPNTKSDTTRRPWEPVEIREHGRLGETLLNPSPKTGPGGDSDSLKDAGGGRP